MSELNAQAPPASPSRLRPTLADLAATLALFFVAAVICGLLWWQVTPLAEYTRTETGAVLNEEQLGIQVASDGWFLVIAAVGGLISGIGLLSWRRRDPLVMVILTAAGGVLATWVMLRTGLLVGPPDPDTVSAAAKVGDKIPLQLQIHTDVLWVVWPIAALVGAVGVIWGTEHRPASDPNAPAWPYEQTFTG